jgi:hypothetical protein
VESTYILVDQYWGGSYWGGSYWGVINIVPFDYAEIWDGSVVMNMAIAGTVRLNKEVNAGVIMNQEITDTYSELEAI